MNYPGYSSSSSIKIIRTTHKVQFVVGTRAADLIRYLENVPGDARITNFSDESGEDDRNMPYIEFEKEEPAE